MAWSGLWPMANRYGLWPAAPQRTMPHNAQGARNSQRDAVFAVRSGQWDAPSQQALSFEHLHCHYLPPGYYPLSAFAEKEDLGDNQRDPVACSVLTRGLPPACETVASSPRSSRTWYALQRATGLRRA
jgi:hypothetical protein